MGQACSPCHPPVTDDEDGDDDGDNGKETFLNGSRSIQLDGRKVAGQEPLKGAGKIDMPTARLFLSKDANEKGDCIEVNSATGIPFESKYFVGKMLFLQRPTPEPAHDDWPYAKHFRPTARRWEMRVQGRFKEDPGDVYFGAEMPRDVSLSWQKQMLANWALKVARMLAAAKGVWFDYSFKLEKLDSDVVLPHYVSPMSAAEALYVTPAGEEPPDITGSIAWNPLKEKQLIEVNTTDTYTVALWNKQLDFARWKIVNMPLNWTSSFTDFIGEQPVSLIAYGIERNNLDGKKNLHVKSKKNILMRLELAPCESNSDWLCHQGGRAVSLAMRGKAEASTPDAGTYNYLKKSKTPSCLASCAWCSRS